jgi:hypothetical protein
MDIVVWLRSLGLEEYEAAFRDNKIDETILPNLMAEDLKDLGVSIVGHRRKILDAIAALRSDKSAPGSSADAATTPVAPSVPPDPRPRGRMGEASYGLDQPACREPDCSDRESYGLAFFTMGN